MANQNVEALATALGHYQNGGNLIQTGAAVKATAKEQSADDQNNSNIAATIAAAQLLDSAVGSFGKSLPPVISTAGGNVPVAGMVISSVSALNNTRLIIGQIPSGSISSSNAWGAIADGFGAIGGAALGVAAVAAGSGAVGK